MTPGKAADRNTLDPEKLRTAAIRRLRIHESGSGVFTMPAAPSLRAHYQEKILALFALLGRPFDADDIARLEELLERTMKEAWRCSPYASLVLRYGCQPKVDGGIDYELTVEETTVAAAYDRWVDERPQPFFGAEPNPKVLDLARSIGAPGDVTILDVGAAEGRNTLPLAREGFAVDAVELSPKFAGLLRDSLATEKLNPRVLEGDFLDRSLEIPHARYRLVVFAGVLVAHVRDVAHLRAMLARASEALTEGGLLLFNLFVTEDGYVPDDVTRELGELFWTVAFTPPELTEATAGLRLRLVDDVPFVDYERTHAPEAWPPTDYFAAYCEAQDLFDLAPSEIPLGLRWLTYRKE